MGNLRASFTFALLAGRQTLPGQISPGQSASGFATAHQALPEFIPAQSARLCPARSARANPRPAVATTLTFFVASHK